MDTEEKEIYENIIQPIQQGQNESSLLDTQVSLQKGGNKNEIILDEQTKIKVGYDECVINDGIAPNKILASGIIEGEEFDKLSYIVINTI